MSIKCPVCRTKAHIASSKEMSIETRENYHQCLNLNCGLVFVSLLTVVRIVRPSYRKPNRALQPELCGESNKVYKQTFNSAQEEFMHLHFTSGMSNKECGEYLGISEAAVRDRRRGSFSPRRSELIALSVYGKELNMDKSVIA